MTDYATVMQIAEELDLHRNTILKLLQDGRLKGEKIDKRWLVDRDDIPNLIIIREEGRLPLIVRKEQGSQDDGEKPKKKKKRGKKAA